MKITKEELLTKPMDRKQFLLFAGMGLLSMLGISNFVSFWMGHPKQQAPSNGPAIQTSGHGFGSSRFGD